MAYGDRNCYTHDQEILSCVTSMGGTFLSRLSPAKKYYKKCLTIPLFYDIIMMSKGGRADESTALLSRNPWARYGQAYKIMGACIPSIGSPYIGVARASRE